jgi:3-oxoacyl-[acyl-carrier-protein] synthase III
MTQKAAITAIATHLPETLLSNEQLAHELGNWSAAQILDKTGIAMRHIAADDECSSDLGVAAAQKLFESGACAPSDIDFLLFCTQSPDYILIKVAQASSMDLPWRKAWLKAVYPAMYYLLPPKRIQNSLIRVIRAFGQFLGMVLPQP